MLKKLIIKSVAIIDYSEIDFCGGLNIMSGETGAGKSVILEALNFVLGAKADKTLIRSGETECSVTAIFDVFKNEGIATVFSKFDIEPEDDLIITRKLTVDGRSTIKLNGQTVTVGMLKNFTSILVDVFGQSKHFWLLDTANQLNLIDEFGGDNVSHNKQILKEKYKKYRDILSQLDELGGDESRRLMRLDVLNYQIDEIEKADIKDGEEQELLDLRVKLINREKIYNSLSAVKESISGENGVSDILSMSLRAYNSISNMSNEFTELYDRLMNLISEANDISSTAENILFCLDDFDFDPDYVESRLELIKKIKKKYGNDFKEINDFLTSAIEERERLENFNEIANKLLIEKEKLEDIIYNLYVELSNLRRKYAEIFATNVQKELNELGMEKAKFTVNFEDVPSKDDCKFSSSNGFDEMEFFFTANQGEPLKPLSSIISGGELSRFMLAIKAQTAKYNTVSTFVFDEIDAGISGHIAKVVAEKFAKISQDVQVVAITHLPQISSMGDNNYLIKKSVVENKTISTVTLLTDDEKVNEVVRLVGGNSDSVSAKEHALDLINQANLYKKSL